MVCLSRARALGGDGLAAIEPGLQARLGDAWSRFEAWMTDSE